MAASSSSAVHYPYDVFISHRGPDTKKTLASHLYRGLSKNGLKPFLDQPELQQGDSLTSQIEDAVRTASIHVAVFSPLYAESSWCLNELLLMLESGKTIIPVFYHVAPVELRWTLGKAGKYAEALQRMAKKRTYEGECRYDSNTIEKWRDALSKVADISGFELDACNGDEGELVDNVVRCVVKKMKKPLHVAKYPAGLDDKVKDFENEVLLQQRQSEKPPVLGIVGLGGVGKTTLAKELFNRESSNYSRSCFLSDVRECVNNGNLISLQKKLLKDLTGSDLEIGSIDENIETLKKHLSSSQIFLILDDVDKVDQVDSLLPDQTAIRSDSLIIITSRNKDILTSSGVENSSIYKLAGLNEQHSLELFCSHAFMQPYPVSQFEPFVDKFLKACQGLPLSLKVFGALLCGKKNPSYWEDQLDKLQRILPSDIKQRLQISFEALDVEEREIFLDVACFFIGEDRDMAVRIWNGSPWKGFQNLEDRCLVEVDSENVIHMHDHLRDLGREIAKAPGLVCGTDNIDDLLQQPSHVITKLRGIRTFYTWHESDKMSWHRDILQIPASEDGLLERILTRVHSPNLIWLRWDQCRYSSLPSWIPVKNLRVLEVSGTSLLEGEWQVPLQLRDLRISGLLGNLPNSIGHLTYLERISLSSFFQLEQLMHFQSLKTLVLPKCTNMKSLPDSFGNLSNLESIDLSTCYYLETLPKSFGNLTKLKYLNLYRCYELTMSRETLGNISTLEHVSLAMCAKIEVLPMQLAHQRSLEKLDLSGTNIKELPNAIGELSNLEVLVVGSRSLDTLPPSLGALKNLKTLKLLDCQELKWLPASVGLLTQLTELAVWNCPISELPFKKVEGETATLRTSSNLDSSTEKCMPRLQLLNLRNTEISEISFVEGVCWNLEYLHISNSKDLVKVGTLPKTLVKLDLHSCRNLRKIEGLSGLARLKTLDIRECKEVEELPGIETLVALKSLLANGCAKLKSIQRLVQLTKLRELHIGGCSELEELPGVEHLRSLENFEAQDCVKLKNIRGLAQWTKLQELDVGGCSALEELPGVEHLRSLRVLKASKCVKLKSIQGLGQLTKLQDLDVSKCCELEDLEGVEHLRSLRVLQASKCLKLKSIQGLGQLTKLQDLHVSECCELEDLEGVEHLRSLRVLQASKCVKLKSIQGLGQLTKLQYLYVSECCELEDLESVEHLRSLRVLQASKCVKLKSIQGLGQLTKLQCLYVSECCELEDLEGVEHLRSLQYLLASKCVKLKTIKGLEQSTMLSGLNVSECSELEDLEGVEHVRSLQASKCVKLKTIKGLGQSTKLSDLNVSECSELEHLEGVEHLRSLEKLRASKCVKLKSIKGLAQLTRLRKLDVSESSKLEGLEGIEHCMSLRALNASGCPKLQWGGGVVEQLHERLKEKLIL